MQWFGDTPLCDEIRTVAEGSYQKKGGYDDGIRGKGYIVLALEAALWAFWSDENSFEKGVLAAVNLGDDTDTTAAIYGQLAGAYYGFEKLPKRWIKDLYAKNFILNLSKWIVHEGGLWKPTEHSNQVMLILSSKGLQSASKTCTEKERRQTQNQTDPKETEINDISSENLKITDQLNGDGLTRTSPRDSLDSQSTHVTSRDGKDEDNSIKMENSSPDSVLVDFKQQAAVRIDDNGNANDANEKESNVKDLNNKESTNSSNSLENGLTNKNTTDITQMPRENSEKSTMCVLL